MPVSKPFKPHLFVFLLNCFLYQVSTGCHELLTQSNGTISSPGFPKPYSESLDCTWKISVNSSANLRVQLKFEAFHAAGKMPDCSAGDYVEIMIGCTPYSLGRFCESIVLPVFYSLDNCMTVVFHSGKQSSGRGFRAHYSSAHALSAVSDINGGCGVSVFEKEHSGNIFTPLWPQQHPHYINCLWRVSIREDLNMKLFFTDFELKQCSHNNYLDIRAGASTYLNSRSLIKLDEKCDKNTPFQVHLTVSTVHIKFESTGAGRRRGFMAGFVTYPKEIEEKFDPKVLVMLAIIFGSLILLGSKTYINMLLQRRRRKIGQQLMEPQEPSQSAQPQNRFRTASQRLNRYLSTRKVNSVASKREPPAVFTNDSQVTQSQSNHFLLPHSSTDSSLLTFTQPVTDTVPSSRPLTATHQQACAATSAEQTDAATKPNTTEGEQ